MKQEMRIDAPPRGELPRWGKRLEYESFFVELVPPGRRSFNVRLSDSFASISFASDEGRSTLADEKLRRFERRPYEYIISPPSFPLRGQSDAAPEVLAIVFDFDELRPQFAAALQMPIGLVEARVVIGNPKPFVTSIANRIRRHINACEMADEYLRSLCLVLLVEMLRPPPKQRAVGRGTVLKKEVFNAILNFIDSNLDGDLSLDTLARLAGVKPHQFGRAFKRRAGQTPHHYVLHRRMDAARRLLQDTDHSIADIAYATGFASQSHMTTTFKREYGATPAQLRAD